MSTFLLDVNQPLTSHSSIYGTYAAWLAKRTVTRHDISGASFNLSEGYAVLLADISFGVSAASASKRMS